MLRNVKLENAEMKRENFCSEELASKLPNMRCQCVVLSDDRTKEPRRG
jgi:hypothetical protein